MNKEAIHIQEDLYMDLQKTKQNKTKTNSSHLSEKQREKVCPQIRIPFVKPNVPEGTRNPITCPKITTLLHGDDLFQINLCFPPIRPVP